MTNRVFTDPRPPQYKKDGVTLNSLGKLYFYEPGPISTTKKAIYSDKDLTSQLTNPVILDNLGRYPTIYMQESDYAVLHTDSADVQIWRVDYYQPPSLESQFDDWDASITYAVNDFVRYTNGKYYISLQSSNKGKTPTSSPTYWSEGFFLEVFNSSKTYSEDNIVYYDGDLYSSLQNSNTGKTPSSSGTWWRRLGKSQFEDWNSSISYSINDIIRYTDDNYYISLQDSNAGNTPGSTTYWSQYFFLTVYNATETYSTDEVVYYDGNIYTSLQNSNTGNTPDTSFTYWKLPGSSVPSIANFTGYTLGYIYTGSGLGTPYDIDSNLTINTWESIGPTGSGATNIWPDLDIVPSGAVAISVIVEISTSRDSSTSSTFSVSVDFRKNSSSSTIPGPTASDYGSSTEPAEARGFAIIDIPVDGSLRFETIWNNVNNSNPSTVQMTLYGFKVA